MPLKDKILSKLGLVDKQSFDKALSVIDRSFKAAKASRNQQDWLIRRNELNRDIRYDLPALRARAYDMRMNNPMVASVAYDEKFNVIGAYGFDLQPMSQYPDGSDDDLANRVIKNSFDQWCHTDFCMVSKRYPFLLAQYLMVEQMLMDGEVIMRQYFSGEAVKGNPFGYTLDFVDPNDIDHLYNAQLSEERQVVMGVQVDKFRRIEGIWVRKKSIYEETITGLYQYGWPRFFIPSSELIFAFDPLHYKQIHGITPLATAMLSLKDLDMWVDYSLQNAKGSAGKMGFLEKTETAIEQFVGAADESGQQELQDEGDLGSKYMDVESGSIEALPAGYKFSPYDPQFPHQQHDMFVRSIGRAAIAGVGRDYTSVMGDRENESYSSGKTGELKNQNADAYRQSIIRELILIPIYENWLKYSLLNGVLNPLNYALYDKYKKHFWQGNKRPFIDMEKENKALTNAKEQGFMSDNEIATMRGRRLEDLFRDKDMKRKLEKKYGFKLEEPPLIATPIIPDAINEPASDTQPLRKVK